MLPSSETPMTPNIVRYGTTIIYDDLDTCSSKDLLNAAILLLLGDDDELPTSTKDVIRTFCKIQYQEIALSDDSQTDSDDPDSTPDPVVDIPPSLWELHQKDDSQLVHLLAKMVDKHFLTTNFKHQLVNHLFEYRYHLLSDWKATAWKMFKDGESITDIAKACGLCWHQVEEAIREGCNLPF